MRLLIADDEQIMLDSIRRILANESEITVETARSGREAIEKTEIFHPDLVIMDIKMPGINGLEALLEIRRLAPYAIFIILSAYDNFTYAQEAIRLSVYEYLVKPINKASLLETIYNARQRIERIKARRQENLSLKEKYKKLVPLIESEFLHTLVNEISSAEFDEYQNLLGISFNAGFFIALSCQNDDPIFNHREEDFLFREKMAHLSENIGHLFPCFIGPLKTNPLTIFVPLSKTYEEDGIFESLDYAQKILDHLLPEEMKSGVIIGVGEVYFDPVKIKHSYYEALQILNKYNGNKQIVHYRDLPTELGSYWEKKLNSLFQEIWEAIPFGNSIKVQILLDKLKNIIFQIEEGEHDHILFDLLQLYLTAYKTAKKFSGCNEFIPSYQRLIQIFDQRNIKEIYAVVSEQIKRMVDYVKTSRENDINSLIKEAKAIIDKDYSKHITLEELAENVNISLYYLSRLFKEEIGESFSEYLTRLRLEKSLKLLAEGLSVKECCFKVGYNDPNYFSRIFKKHYGLAPTDYRHGRRT